jgi:hypothetical protein
MARLNGRMARKKAWIHLASATHEKQVMPAKTLFHYAPLPNIALQLTPTASLLVPFAALRRR